MASYELRLRASVANDLRGIPAGDVRRILTRIQSLSDNPRPSGVEKLATQERYRLRQGSYRIIYEILDAERAVDVVMDGASPRRVSP